MRFEPGLCTAPPPPRNTAIYPAKVIPSPIPDKLLYRRYGDNEIRSVFDSGCNFRCKALFAMRLLGSRGKGAGMGTERQAGMVVYRRAFEWGKKAPGDWIEHSVVR